MIDATKAVSHFIKNRGITISAVAEKTGIPYDALYSSFSKSRKLRADELLEICNFLEVDPMKFYTNH